MSKAVITHTLRVRGAWRNSNVQASPSHRCCGAGSAVASAAETGIKTTPIAHRYDARPTFGHRGLYDYAAPQAGYGWYDNQWDPYTWSTGNGYY
jgi:hypothetical protein